MRSMNMLQLLGGVAVAGAVAAGTTAFTASGLSNTISGSSFVGGTITQNVVGAVLSAAVFHPVTTGSNNIDSITLTLAGEGGATITTVTAKITGKDDGGSAATAEALDCTGTTTVTCVPTSASATVYYTDITSISVTAV
jgi:hypothetical protein